MFLYILYNVCEYVCVCTSCKCHFLKQDQAGWGDPAWTLGRYCGLPVIPELTLAIELAKGGLQLLTLLPPPPKDRAYRYVPPCSVYVTLRNGPRASCLLGKRSAVCGISRPPHLFLKLRCCDGVFSWIRTEVKLRVLVLREKQFCQ